MKGILGSRFTGASGDVSFVWGPERIRDPKGTVVGAYNVRAKPVGDGKTTNYEAVLTSIMFGEGEWEDVEGEEFIYRDGTTNAPYPLRETYEFNYLSSWVRALEKYKPQAPKSLILRPS